MTTLPPVLQPQGPARLHGFERIVNPAIDRHAVGADIVHRTNGLAHGPYAAFQAADYHGRMKRAGAQWWRNEEYMVQAALASAVGLLSADAPPVLWLRIYRHDGERPSRHWRDLQRIKNELIGAEMEAVEIYPRESQLKDGENSYHLWVPLGWTLGFGLPGGRSESVDGLPAVSTRFVRAA